MAQTTIDPQIIKEKIHGCIREEDNLNDITVRYVITVLEGIFQTNINDDPEMISLIIEEITKFIEGEWKPHLKELVARKCVQGIVSKRKLNPDLPQRCWEEVLEDPSVQAVIITSENVFHAKHAFKALEHNKHVLVEYPLAVSFDEAIKLYELAHQKKLVLHVEYIGNLMESHLRLKKELQGEVLKEGIVQFIGGISRLISVDHKLSGWPSFSGIMRLKKLTDLFGEMKLHSASMEYFTEEFTTQVSFRVTGFKMTAVLEPVSHPNAKITWTEDRQPSSKRGSNFKFVLASGKVVDTEPAGWQPAGLFMTDMCQFAHEVMGERVEELAGNEKWTLHCMKVADEIEKKCKENLTYTHVKSTDSIVVNIAQ